LKGGGPLLKCKNCGLLKEAHVEVEVPGAHGLPYTVWQCPDDSGNTYPAVTDVKVELHYRAGADNPWLAKWVHPIVGAGEVDGMRAVDALELAAHEIEKSREEKSPEEVATEEAIKET
jgi:hypothetical protein